MIAKKNSAPGITPTLLPLPCSPARWLKRLHIPLLFALLLHNPHTISAAGTNNTPAVRDCDINKGPCAQKIGTVQVVLDIGPKPVTAMKELTFTVTLTGMSDYENLKLKLQMPDMYMGTNQVTLVKVGRGKYTGTGVVPRCHSGKKVWSATVELPGLTPPEASFLFNVL